ncbi:MAG: (2Fe-2S)-binding protein [Candidatus Rokuibacteriota bacterium]|nr:MAG: (2Fe-2S)-binding protein [Candidatus Rokubacteria bacterium]
MPTYSFYVNDQRVSVEAPADLALLWVLRDKLGITGPKYGCGVNVCKACTCLVNNKAVQTCVTPVSSVAGKRVTTIEGLANGDVLHPVQQAWLDLDVPQCGFCQPGQIMNAVALLKTKRNPSDADIDAIENICRCATYGRIRQAIKNAAAAMP